MLLLVGSNHKARLNSKSVVYNIISLLVPNHTAGLNSKSIAYHILCFRWFTNQV